MSGQSPLIEVCMAFTADVAPRLDPIKQDIAREIVTRYIDGELQFPEASRKFEVTVGSSNPIDKIHEIILLPDEPIPGFVPEVRECGGTQRKKTRSWTTQEDMRLLAGVHKYGLDAWSSVAHFVGNGRTRSQCSQRWIRVLDPRISKELWTRAESNKLLELVKQHGEKSWMKIATELGNRSDVQCRYHFLQLQREAEAREARKQISVPHPEINMKEPDAPAKKEFVTPEPDRFNKMMLPPLQMFHPLQNTNLPPIPSVQSLATASPLPQVAPALQPASAPATVASETWASGNKATGTGGEEMAYEIQEDVPIPLTTSLDLRKSEPLFDSNLWLTALIE